MSKIAHSNVSLLMLTIAVALLALFNFALPKQTAEAASSIKDRDYQLVTSKMKHGGEALIVVDNRSGRIAVFTYDFASRTLVSRTTGSMVDVFPR